MSFDFARLAYLHSNYDSFILFTDKRCIAKPGIGSPAVIPYNKIVEVKGSWNWLFCLKEIEVKRSVTAQGRGRQRGAVETTKSDFLDAIPNIDYYCSFLQRMQSESSPQSAVSAAHVDDEEEDE
jgi:hypothetical protein